MKKRVSKVVTFILVLSMVMVSLMQVTFARAVEVEQGAPYYLDVKGYSNTTNSGYFEWSIVDPDNILLGMIGDNYDYRVTINGEFVDIFHSSYMRHDLSGLDPGTTYSILVEVIPPEFCMEGYFPHMLADNGGAIVPKIIKRDYFVYLHGEAQFTTLLEEKAADPLYAVRVETDPAGVSAVFAGYGTGFADGASYNVTVISYDSENYVFTGFSTSASGSIAGADVELVALFDTVIIDQVPPEEVVEEEPVIEEPVVEEPVVIEPVVEEPVVEEPQDNILDEDVAQDLALPDTSGIPLELFGVIGIALTAVGSRLHKRK